MSNLLEETIDAITRSGHTISQIVFIGSSNGKYRCTWDEFQKLADREYDSGYGSNEVASDLIVLFGDGKKMWRGDYGGSEWWEFDSPAVVDYTLPGLPITNLIGDLFPTIELLNIRKGTT